MKYFNILDSHMKMMKVSKIIMGAAPMGTDIDKSLSFDMLDRFVELGGTTIDTARVYCEWIKGGEFASEQTIGEWVKSRNNRSNVLIVTKGGHPRITDLSISRLSRQEILHDMEVSLKTLKMDYVDIYLLHRDDTSRPVEDIMETLGVLVKDGKTRAIGVSNWSVERILEANSYARKNGIPELCVSQIQWSLAECFPETFNDKTLLCMTKTEYNNYLKAGIPVMAYSSQANGVFTKAGDDGLEKLGQKLQKFVTPKNIKRYNNLQNLCKAAGYGKTAASIGFITDNKLEAAAIVGCRNMEQLEDSFTAMDITLSLQEIDSLIK